MSDTATTELVLIIISFTCFGLIHVYAWLSAIGHVLGIALRRLTGRPLRVDLLRLSVFLPLALVGVATLGGLLGVTLSSDGKRLSAVIVTLTIVLMPVVVSLVATWRRGGASPWLYLTGLGAVLALPTAMILSTLMTVLLLTEDLQGRVDLIRPDTFVIDPSPASCTVAMVRALGFATQMPSGEGGAELVLLFQFWLDATLKAVFLDAFEVFGCGVTLLEHNRENVALSALIFGYRTFAAAMVLGVLLAPILAPLRRTRAGLLMAARQSWSAAVAGKRAGRAGPAVPEAPPPFPTAQAGPATEAAGGPAAPRPPEG